MNFARKKNRFFSQTQALVKLRQCRRFIKINWNTLQLAYRKDSTPFQS